MGRFDNGLKLNRQTAERSNTKAEGNVQSQSTARLVKKSISGSSNGWLTTVAWVASADFGWKLDYTIWEIPLVQLLLLARQKTWISSGGKQITLSDQELVDDAQNWQEMVKASHTKVMETIGRIK